MQRIIRSLQTNMPIKGQPWRYGKVLERYNLPRLKKLKICTDQSQVGEIETDLKKKQSPNKWKFTRWFQRWILSNIHCHSVVSDSLWRDGLQHISLPCLSLSPGICSNSCPFNWWCHLTISSCCLLLLLLYIFPSIRVFSRESPLQIRWPKYWSFSFSISPSNEYSGLISFRIDCLDLFAVQGTQ